MWKELKTVETSEECCSFLDAIDIWINKPHVVNRYLCGAKIFWQFSNEDYTTDSLEEQITKLIADKGEQEGILVLTAQVLGENTQEIKMCMRELLPKSLDKYSILRELVITGELAVVLERVLTYAFMLVLILFALMMKL